MGKDERKLRLRERRRGKWKWKDDSREERRNWWEVAQFKRNSIRNLALNVPDQARSSFG